MEATEKERKCMCRACLRERDERLHGYPYEIVCFIVCATCGNKRCPHATDHRHACTNSNAPGQAGSVYEGAGLPRVDR